MSQLKLVNSHKNQHIQSSDYTRLLVEEIQFLPLFDPKIELPFWLYATTLLINNTRLIKQLQRISVSAVHSNLLNVPGLFFNSTTACTLRLL